MIKEIIQVDWEKLMKSSNKELKKYNHIIDSRKPRSMSLLARNLMNILLYIRQKENANEFQVPIVELKNHLRLSTRDYKSRIEKAIFELSIPIELRDFKYKGKDISYVPASLLTEPTIYKDNINYVDIKISDKFIAAIEETVYQNPKTHESAANWKKSFVDSYRKFYGVQLNIPRWQDIASKYDVK